MGRKKNQPKNEEESEEEQEQFHVEVITKAKVTRENGWEYWVKWAGYTEGENSWEPERNVESCQRLLKSFWEHIGMDEDDVPYDTVFHAEESWIEKEKKYFARNIGKTIKVKVEKVDVSLKEPTKGKARVKSKQASSKTSISNRAGSQSRKRRTREPESSEDDDSLLSKKTKTKHKRIIDDHSNSEPEGQTGQDITSEAMSRSKVPPMSESAPAFDVEDANSLFSGPSRSPSPDSDIPFGQRAQRPGVKAGMSATATNQVSSAMKPPNTLPAHKERRRNPQVRMLSYTDPAVGVTGGGGIPTKNKLARLDPPTPTTSKPALPPGLVIPKKTSLPSFKKKKATLASPAIPSPSTPSASSMADMAVATGSNRFTDTQEVVQSPVSLVNGDDGWGSPAPESPRVARKPSFSLPRTQTQTMRDSRRMPIPRSNENPPDPMAEVDQFLAPMMPPALAAPMYETTEDDETSILAPSLSRATPKVIKPTESRVPRKWKWEGEAFIEVGEDKADHLCYVTLNEPTEPPSVGLRLSACTSTLGALRLKKLHYISDIFLVLPACGAVQQFCRVAPKEDRDENALGTLWKYMELRRMFTYAEMLLDNEAVGLFFIFPSSLDTLCDVFGVPGDLRDEKVLVGALVPWTLSAQQLADNDWKPQPLRELPDGPTSHFPLPESLQTNPLPLLFHYAIHVLKFPQEPLKWIADGPNNRPYYICHGPGDGKMGKHTASTSKEDQPGIETKLLQVILDHCRPAIKKSHKEELRVIFVHIGDLTSLRKVSNVGSRKYKQGNVRFFTYGTHESMPPSRWGVREVYPLGGIVTFTANAILEDPITTYKLMDRLDEHPLWMGFLTPSVMGAVAKLSCGPKDPLIAVDENKFPYQILLDLIDGGNISLLTAPPSSRRVVPDKSTGRLVDNSLQWIITQLTNIALSPRSVVEQCLNAIESAQEEYEKDAMKAAAHDAFTQLGCMQYQPALMDDYRRFVLVVGKKDRLQDNKGLLELVTINNFDFKDNLFREPLC